MFTDVLQNSCSQKFRKFHRKALVSEAFLIKLQALGAATLLKRDSCEIGKIFKNTLFYWTYPVAVSDSFRFPACNLKKKFPQRCFSVNFAKILRTTFWQNTSRWLFLKFICEFQVLQNIFFSRAPLRSSLFHAKVAEFQPADAVKN